MNFNYCYRRNYFSYFFINHFINFNYFNHSNHSNYHSNYHSSYHYSFSLIVYFIKRELILNLIIFDFYYLFLLISFNLID